MTPLVLLHGFSGHPRVWDGIIEALPRGVAVLRPAIAGHEGAPLPEHGPNAFDRELDRLADLLRAHCDRPAHVLGYSLGGRLALGLGVRWPALVARLTLISANPGLHTPEERRVRAEADEVWAQLLERDGLHAFIAAWERQPLFGSEARLPLERRNRQRELRARSDAAGLVACMRALGLGNMPCYWRDLPTLKVPLHAIVGDHDAKFRAIAQRMASVASVAVQVVPNAGHNIVLERPDFISDYISENQEEPT